MSLQWPILWRFAELDGPYECLPGNETGWLGPRECSELSTLRDANRRRGSLLARLLAKRLLLEHDRALATDLRAIEIVARDASGRGVRPKVTIAGRIMPWSLSLSHTETAALAAICRTPGMAVGVDLVRQQALPRGFVRGWFDDREQALAAEGDAGEACRLWAVKEAVYKAINRNDRFAPRQVQVRRAPAGHYICTYRGIDLEDRCRIASRTWAGHVAALAWIPDEAALCELGYPSAVPRGRTIPVNPKNPVLR